MDNKTLTPVMLWQGFNNECCPLDINIIGYRSEGDVNITECYFTALREKDGDVRVYARTYTPANAGKTPIMIMLEEFDKSLDNKLIMFFVRQGYTVLTFDYKGIKPGGSFTQYPHSLSYGNMAESGDHLNTAVHGVQNTCLFLWSRLARRAITFALSSPVSNGQILLYGECTAVNIAVQAASMDGRVTALLAVRNNGHSKYNANTPECLQYHSIEEENERNRWMIGCAVLSYVKFLTCPILYFAATNDPIYDVMQLSDTLPQLQPGIKKYLSLSTGTNGCLYSNFYPTAANMLSCILNGRQVSSPHIRHTVDGGNIYYSVDVDAKYDNIAHIELSVSYGEEVSSVRSWHRYNVGVSLDGTGRIPIKVYSPTDMIYAFLTVYYVNGVMLSTPIYSVNPDQHRDELKINIPNNRIIYEKKLGTTPFYINSKGLTADQRHIIMKSGALDITGVTTDMGELVTYKIGDIQGKNADSILQFDCFTNEDRDIIIRVTDSSNVTYIATVHLYGSNDWTKVALRVTDFKDSSLKALKSYCDIKVLTWSNIENVLLNNIIWI